MHYVSIFVHAYSFACTEKIIFMKLSNSTNNQ